MRILLLVCFISFAFHASAQVIEKGEKLFGGTLGGYFSNSQHSSESRNTNVGFQPSLSFAIKDNLVAGARGSIAYSRHRNMQVLGPSMQSSVLAGIGLFLKKYKPFENRFGLNFEHGLSTSFHFNSATNVNSVKTESQGWGAGYHINPGVFYRLTERFLAETNIGGLSAYYQKGSGGTYSFSVGASFLQSFNLGINYRFGKRKAQQDQ